MKAVIYARVSTDKQTIDNQTQHLIGWIGQRGYELIETYQETETAWKDGHQKELSRLVKDAYQRKFDIMVVWALDRITRGGAAALMEFWEKMTRFGVKILSYQEPYTDWPSEFTPIFLAISGTMGNLESKRRSERTAAGIERKRSKGSRWGRPPGSRDTKQRKRRAAKL